MQQFCHSTCLMKNGLMKRLNILFAVSLLLGLASCHKDNIATNTPACIRNEITINRNDPNWMIGSVDEYFFQNRLVYAFSPDNKIIADGSTEIKDESCNTMCQVGGFGGPAVNLCNGENFFQNAALKRNIWKK
jgi:hypothetical protein